jgi:hypothetical protein
LTVSAFVFVRFGAAHNRGSPVAYMLKNKARRGRLIARATRSASGISAQRRSSTPNTVHRSRTRRKLTF